MWCSENILPSEIFLLSNRQLLSIFILTKQSWIVILSVFSGSWHQHSLTSNALSKCITKLIGDTNWDIFVAQFLPKIFSKIIWIPVHLNWLQKFAGLNFSEWRNKGDESWLTLQFRSAIVFWNVHRLPVSRFGSGPRLKIRKCSTLIVPDAIFGLRGFQIPVKIN